MKVYIVDHIVLEFMYIILPQLLKLAFASAIEYK